MNVARTRARSVSNLYTVHFFFQMEFPDRVHCRNPRGRPEKYFLEELIFVRNGQKLTQENKKTTVSC